MSYLTHLKTMLVEAIKETFDEQYPEPEWRGLHASIEYPVEEVNYPGVWIDYSDAQALRIAGVDHVEYVEVAPDGSVLPFTRWRFQGYASYTIAALSSYERDRLYDEMVKVLAFGREHPQRRRFREYIERNEFIAANFDFDEIEVAGNAAAPGTPWGTDEIIYERTINMEVIGEFVTEPTTGALLPLRRITIVGTPTDSQGTPLGDPLPTIEIPRPIP